MSYSDESDAGIDHHESARDFIQSIDDFVYRKAQKLADVRVKFGLSGGLNKEDFAEWRCLDLSDECKLFFLTIGGISNDFQRKQLAMFLIAWQNSLGRR